MQADNEADALEQEARLNKQAAATKEAPPADEEGKPWFFRGHDTVSLNMLAMLLSLCSPLAMHTMLTAGCAHHSSRSPCSQKLLQVTRDAQQSFKLGPRTAAGVDQDSRNHVKTNDEVVDTITSDIGLSDDVSAQLDAEQDKMDKVTCLSTSLDACATLVELRV